MEGLTPRGVSPPVELRTYERRRRRESGVRGKPVHREGDNPEFG